MQGICKRQGPGEDPIGIQTNLGCGTKSPRHRLPPAGKIAGVLAFFALQLPLCAQQAPQPAPSQFSDAALPAAPQAQTLPLQPPTPAPDLPGSIHGIVIDRDGTVCEGAHIALSLSEPAASPARKATSDGNGRFDFANVPAGAFQLVVSSNGFVAQTVAGTLHPGESYQTPPIRLLIATAASEVRVTASSQEIAVEQFRAEEEQHILGFIPNFYVSYVPNAPPLTARQKFHLAWRTSIDPVTILSSGFFAGIEQAGNDYSGFGQGSEGYAKRFGANYADTFIGAMLSGAVLPSLLKQDPRYFYKGTGSKRSRALYAIASAVICKGDNGHWQPNYSAIISSVAAGGISNLYYPAADRNGVSLTFENAGLGFASSALENLFQEFLIRKLTPKVPNYGSSKP